MLNSTYSHPSELTLTFVEMAGIKYAYSTLIFLCFAVIAASNCAVVGTIVAHRSLHEPMYILIAALSVNGLYGSAAFFPNLFINLLSKSHTIPYVACIIQMFGLHTYVGCEMAILAVMAYDRYVCICIPLRYNSLMSLYTVLRLIAAAWVYAVVQFTVQLVLTVRLPLCGSVVQKFYCDNWSVVKLSCVDTTANNIYGLFITAVILGLIPGTVLISYLQILRVCVRSSSTHRSKALQTCTPHMMSLTYFVLDLISEALLNRSPANVLPIELRVLISVQVFVIAPFLNPLIYGLKLKEIRVKAKHMFCKVKIFGVDGKIGAQ
uniref:G-protein coupled receptors family 1 profile domain-containing protein n=1 Tax=Xenopus tropicalis TaxID=8364 RepID=A0A1B8Y8T8_XENTR|eukprot:XP_002941600.3 PREDICTED: putative gustatory receptor clone PTE03 [Xenopus tropicalis]